MKKPVCPKGKLYTWCGSHSWKEEPIWTEVCDWKTSHTLLPSWGAHEGAAEDPWMQNISTNDLEPGGLIC